MKKNNNMAIVAPGALMSLRSKKPLFMILCNVECVSSFVAVLAFASSNSLKVRLIVYLC